ncbi:ATP-binding protein [Muricoccus radiodurans]|uniref:ATP-binding protein n=1 Tax=Muricoccus radiodurans TaxID=2231721 RepID=UPI003CE9055A
MPLTLVHDPGLGAALRRVTSVSWSDGAWLPWRRAATADTALVALLEALPQGAALLDPEGRLLQGNTALQERLGPTLPLKPGLPALSLFIPESRAAVEGWLASPLQPLTAWLAVPEGGNPPAVSLSLRALTDTMRVLLLEDSADRARGTEGWEAADRLRAVGQLAGGIAHDVNNLLSIILAAIESTRRVAPATGEELKPAQAAAERGASLVQRLLAFARRQRLEPRVVVLDEVLGSAGGFLRGLLGSRVELVVRMGAPGRRVKVDPIQLDQVLLNLAANARDVMPSGGRLVMETGTAVALREEPGIPDALPPGRWTVLSVSDTGPGIPHEVLPRIFEPFFTTKAAAGGSGLGLATVHGIVRQSGGALQVETRPGEGARFLIYLPRHEGPAEAVAPEERSAARAIAAPVPTPSRHILLVDDEAPLRRLTAAALERAGHRITQAEDAETALEMVEEGLAPEVLISDIVMPGMDGLALARAVRARHPGVPVILASGYSENVLGPEAEGDGFGFIAKPYRPSELAAAVARLECRPPGLKDE